MVISLHLAVTTNTVLMWSFSHTSSFLPPSAILLRVGQTPLMPQNGKERGYIYFAFHFIKQAWFITWLTGSYSAQKSTYICLLHFQAHSHYIIVQNFVKALEKFEKEFHIQRILKHLCDLFALHGIFSNMGDFLQGGHLSGKQSNMATESYLDILAVVRWANPFGVLLPFFSHVHVIWTCRPIYESGAK